MIEARITNFGRTKPFNTRKGPVMLMRRKPIFFYDKEIIEDLKQHSQIGYNRLEVKIIQEEPRTDYSKYKIQQLKSIASKIGIKGFFTMTKSELIKRLEEKDESKNSH